MNDGVTGRKADLTEESFQNSPDKFFKKKPIDLREEKYIVRDEEELHTFSDFEDNAIKFEFEGETSLIIKEQKQERPYSDQYVAKLENLAEKLSHYHVEHDSKSTSYLRWIYDSIWGMFRKPKRKSRHLTVTKVIVSLTGCKEVSDNGIKCLAKMLKHFENLVHLEIEIKNTEVTDQSVGFISALIADLKHLEYFYVDFSGCKITDEALFVLSSDLKLNKGLQEIWLRFSWCQGNRITNEGIHAISKALENKTNLRVLLLEFNGNSQIGSKGLSSIFSSIKDISSLRKLFFYFETADASDNFLLHAAEILPHFSRLELFGLNLAQASCLSIQGMQKLEKALLSMKSLKTGLYFYLSGCFALSEKDKVQKSFNEIIKTRNVQNFILELG